MLDHDNFYATTGGHGGCRGCGEVTAIRLVMSTSHAIGESAAASTCANSTPCRPALRQARHRRPPRRTPGADRATIAALETRLYQHEGGPTGNGPASR